MEMDDRIMIKLVKKCGQAKGRCCSFCYLVRYSLGLVVFVLDRL